MAVETQRSFVIISAVSELRGSPCSFHSIYLYIKSSFILTLLLTIAIPSSVHFTPPHRSDCVSVEHSSLIEGKKENCSGLNQFEIHTVWLQN